MPNYNVKCRECDEHHPTYLPYIELNNRQLNAINRGEGFQLYRKNIPAGTEAPEDLWESEDLREVHECCGSES